jgi:hypothetical protein
MTAPRIPTVIASDPPATAIAPTLEFPTTACPAPILEPSSPTVIVRLPPPIVTLATADLTPSAKPADSGARLLGRDHERAAADHYRIDRGEHRATVRDGAARADPRRLTGEVDVDVEIAVADVDCAYEGRAVSLESQRA